MPGDSFFTETGDGIYVAGRRTAGPWSPDAQHGGPPSALLLDAILRAAGDGPHHVGRLTCELLRPVPLGELRVSARETRPGRDVRLFDAQIEAGGRTVMLARAWLLRPAPAIERGAVGRPVAPTPPPPAGLAENHPEDGPMWASPDGYLSAVEWRGTHGDFNVPGPGGTWSRPRVPLIAGRETAPPARAALVADSGSGIGLSHDLREVQAINVDLTIHFDRDPDGEWIHLEAATTGVSGGGSFSRTVLSDLGGPFASVVQTLLVRPL